ncbi:hypothetical protein O1611_g3952 [Lasiodiplodia mahajangana]|uniref:Uncharacterized protein n=1 Tax=Lasiodiplodia mahajangana TaxID=1108764 RepID=A0ACC2JQ97_9PEZI|nr:hypothetical protein O1611_g3952 [Lasiodiplodia mahajangana]
MTPEIMYTIIFGSLAFIVAVAAMIQSYLQQQRRTLVPDIEAQAPWHNYRAYGLLAAVMLLAQLQRPNHAMLRPQRFDRLDALHTPRVDGLVAATPPLMPETTTIRFFR